MNGSMAPVFVTCGCGFIGCNIAVALAPLGGGVIVYDRYVAASEALLAGIGEDAVLHLFSPDGCSKGGAEQYVRDYGPIYGLRTAVLRMSCIYGSRQLGNEDQGWLAHFMIQALRRNPI